MFEMENISTKLPIVSGPFIAGKILSADNVETLLNPYDQTPFANVAVADASLMEQTIEAAVNAFDHCKNMAAYQRSAVLKKVSELIHRDRQQLAAGITTESGKPITAALAEVDRAVFTFQVAAEEALRINGEILTLDWLPGCEQRQAHVCRVPRGPIAGITPFNFPLNLVAHKIAPAMAAGNPIIIKPALQTAMTAIRLGLLIVEAGWPAEGIAIVPCHTDIAQALITDERIKLLTFTGSPEVGWHLKAIAGKKPVTLELGGNAGNIIEADANLDYALERVVWGGYLNAGQTCISVQRVYIHHSIYDQAKKKLIALVKSIKYGNPWLPDTIVGPVINEASAERIETCIHEALEQGARLLAGGNRYQRIIEPTLIENDNEALNISQTELFGPVIVISSYQNFKEAVARVSESKYGLQAGLFTRDMGKIQYAIKNIEAGGININDVSTFRIDHMPYGGVKASGFGREGLRYAIEEMTEMKLITYNHSIL